MVDQKPFLNKMKLFAAVDLHASSIFSLGVASHLSSTVALTVPTTAPIALVQTSNVLPNLFPLLNVTSLNAGHYGSNCVPTNNDEAWYSVPKEAKWRYDSTCYEAVKLFQKEQQRYDAEGFEFLAPGAQPKTKLRTMLTPRRYSFGMPSTFAANVGVLNSLTSEMKTPGGLWNPSCTVVVAMLNFASPGQLPNQPPGPFQPTDVTNFEDLVDAGGEVLAECIRARGVGILPDLHFGWVRAGKSRRRIPMQLVPIR